MSIKLTRIGDKLGKEKKLSLTLEPHLAAQLDLYGEAYAEQYKCESPASEDLAIAILSQFFATDSGFRTYQKQKNGTYRARGRKATSTAQPNLPKPTSDA